MTFENDLTLNVHLGIYGNWSFGGDETFTGASRLVRPQDRRKNTPRGGGTLRRSSRTEEYGALPYCFGHGWADLVGPTICRTLTRRCAPSAPSSAPTRSTGCRPRTVLPRGTQGSRPIGVILMDQAAISGVGNIFRAESLYRQAIDPLRPGKSLSDEGWSDSGKTSTCWSSACAWGASSPPSLKTAPACPKAEAWPDHANYVVHASRRALPPLRNSPSAWKKSQAANSTGAPARV